jgi:rod shape-determining protein MreB
VFIVEEPMAAAIGIGLPVKDPTGSMVVDIGGGTTDIGVVSLGGLVNAKNIKIAGDRFNTDIISYIRSEFKILVGDKSAEDLKIAVGSAMQGADAIESVVRGRDLVTGLPREIVVTDSDVREAMTHSLEQLVDAVKEILETTPPEVVSDILKRGIYLAGGGALIRGLPILLQEELGVPVHVADDPLTAVVRGAGKMLEDLDHYKEAFVHYDDAVSPQA